MAPAPRADLQSLPDSVPVLISGGGPSGLFLAIDLDRRGVASLVIEPRPSVDPTRPKAKTTNARTMTHLRRVGLADALRDAAALSAEYAEDVIFCSSLTGYELRRFRNAFQVVRGRYDLQPESGQQVAQPVVEEVLRQGVVDAPLAQLATGLRVERIETGPRPRALVSDERGDSRWIECDHLVGADGGSSLVRRELGIPLEGGSAAKSNFNFLFRSEQLADAVTLGPAVQYWVLRPAAAGMIGRMDLDSTWWVIIQNVDLDATPDPVALVHELAGTDVDVDVIATDRWTARMLLAGSYGRDNVHLIGDAVHLNPPWGGHGFNTCIGDAANLAWKIGADAAGWAGKHLLASYEDERRPIAARTIADAAANGRVLASDFAQTILDEDSVAGATAREAMARDLDVKQSEFSSLGLVLGYQYPRSPLVVDDGSPVPPEDPILYTASTRPGSLLPHTWLGDHSLYDALGPWFTLVVDSGDPRADAFSQAAGAASEATGVPLMVLSVDFAAHPTMPWQGPALLVRPDQHVAWRGDSADAIRGALAVASGHPDSAPHSATLEEADHARR
jgi:2-polyprenyl-6-methoxyphenol hydroxylase-like FAD-dependent oxidoreductase